MDEEVKRVICGFCNRHCRLKASLRDGQLVSLGYKKLGAEASSQSAELWERTTKVCGRLSMVDEYLDHPQRLNYPLKRAGQRGENRWQRITWEQALDEIAGKLKQIRKDFGAEAVAFCTVGENNCAEEYRQRFQSLFGSPNFGSPLPVCTGGPAALSLLISGWLDYWPALRPETRCILLLGADTANCALYFWNNILNAKKTGTKLIVVDPRRTDTAAQADIWLQLRPGTDAALLLAMINVIIEEKLYDKAFIEKWCYGFDKLSERVRDYPPEKVAEITWVPADKIREAARLYATTRPGIVVHGMGLEHIPNTMGAVHCRQILPALTGNLDVPGGNLFMEGHPRVRLAAEIELTEMLSPQQKSKMVGREFKLFSWPTFDKICQNIKKVRERPLSALWVGANVNLPSLFRAILTGKPYPIKAMITEGTNPLLTHANARLAYEAMKKIDFHVVIDIFMTPTCQLADYVLPAASWLEKPVLMGGDYSHYVQGGAAILAPLYERKPEYNIWRELGLRLGQQEYWPWQTLEEAFSYRLAPLGLTFEQFLAKGAIDGAAHRHKKYETMGFGTPTGKFELYSTVLEEMGFEPLPRYEESLDPLQSPELAKDFPMILITGGRVRGLYQSQYRQIKSIRQKHPDPIAQLNPAQAAELGIADGDWLWIETPISRSKFKCQYFEGIDRRVVHAEHGWWFPEEPGEEPSLHGLWRSNINAVLDDAPELCDALSGAWVLKGARCRVYRAED
jgi:thiosulfate reductase/polysulfide reductase chain A